VVEIKTAFYKAVTSFSQGIEFKYVDVIMETAAEKMLGKADSVIIVAISA
jgi:hypothetical protein